MAMIAKQTRIGEQDGNGSVEVLKIRFVKFRGQKFVLV